MSTKKVLYSPEFGAGFATWNRDSKKLAEDEQLVRMVEAGEHSLDKNGPFATRCRKILGGGHVCLLGVETLRIAEVDGPYRIEEYDGNESVMTSDDWW